jgi:hypothetical protein
VEPPPGAASRSCPIVLAAAERLIIPRRHLVDAVRQNGPQSLQFSVHPAEFGGQDGRSSAVAVHSFPLILRSITFSLSRAAAASKSWLSIADSSRGARARLLVKIV